MERFTQKTLRSYLEERILPKLNFTNPQIQEIIEVSGGLSSLVFKVLINNQTFYVKQVLEGEAANLGVLPKDLTILFSDDRQQHEARAIKLFNDAIGQGFAPDVIYLDTKDKVLVLSDVADNNSRLFEDAFEDIVNEKITVKLAEIAAKLANNTFGKYESLRSKELDLKIRKVKLKYYYSQLFDNLPANKELINEIVKKFVNLSINYNKALSHGDYHPKNIIIKENSNIALIDFEEAIIHDPVWDISTLLAHYLLRVLNYPEHSKKLKDLSILLFNKFLENLKITEERNDLEYRMKNYIVGWMMLRVDGISKAKWITDENVKKIIREKATQFLLSDLSINQLLNSF